MTTVPEAAQTVQFDTTWTTAVRRVSELAQARLPEALHGRIQRGTALALTGGVWFEPDGHTCQVRAADGQTWYSANGSCPCTDSQYAPEHLCKHRIARGLYLRASELLREGLPPVSAQVLGDPEAPKMDLGEVRSPDITTGDITTAPPATIPLQYIVQIQGRPYIKFAGLLALAHAHGLQSLTATWTFNDAELSLAYAVALFTDGRRFEESGDSCKANVGAKVALHWRRISLTRAKSRALRDALGCDLVAVEELADHE